MKKEVVLFVDSETSSVRSAIGCIKRQGYHSLWADDAEQVSRILKNSPPVIILVNMDLPNSMAITEKIFSSDADAPILVMASDDKRQQVLKALKDKVAGFVRKPLDPLELEIALRHTSEFIELRRRVNRSRGHLNESAQEIAAEMIDTERFLAVRQIVDKMSAFIAQVASDVHGGVKYFHELPYFVSVHSRDCKVLAANQTYIRYLGNRINGNSCEIYSGKRATTDACPVGRTIRNEAYLETRALVKYASGARVPVNVHTAPIFNNNGEVDLILEIFAGSKEIDRMAEEVRTTQQRYHQLFDAMPSYLAVLDRRLQVTTVNRRFKEDFGNQVGKLFFDVLRPGNFPAFHDPISQTLNDGQPHRGEMVLTDVNSVQYNMMAWTAPIKTLAGKLIQILVIFTDITELRQLQDNLSSLGLMIGSISHDLKGCLTGLDAGLYMIDTGFYRDRAGRIEEGLDVTKLMVERIRKMVSNILYYAKERELEIERVDVEQFAAGVASNVDNRIRGANITFECRFEQSLGEFEIDTGLLRSTLINVLENAMEACIEDPSNKESHINFRAERVDNDIQFDITDNGGGMTTNQMKNMFTMFYSTKGNRGTGLGLFIANQAVHKHGGNITVDSKPGEGTAFHIRLPREYAATSV